jgi:hypothetical protein
MLRLILEFITITILFIVAYYGIWFLCLINDACYYQNFSELV